MKIDIFLICVGMFCSSCIILPFKREVAPILSGQIFSSYTHTPVANIPITYRCDTFSMTTNSDNEGNFSIGPLKQWHYLVYLGSPGLFPCPINRPQVEPLLLDFDTHLDLDIILKDNDYHGDIIVK